MPLADHPHCFPRFARGARDGVTAEPRRVAGGSFDSHIWHDPIALARTGRQDPVVPNLMGARRWNQRHESFDELVSLHEDVCGAVAPAGLQAQSEPPVRAFFESFMGERRPGDVAAEPLEASSVSRGDGHVRVEAHPAVPRHARRCLRVLVGLPGLPGLDAIAEPAPWISAVRPGSDAGSQRRGGQHRQYGLVAGKRVLVVSGALSEQPLDSTGGARQHPRHLIGVRWGQGEKTRRSTLANGVGVGAVQREGVKVDVQVECRAEALDEGDGATLLRPNTPLPSRTPAKLREQRSDEGPEHGARESCVVGTPVPERAGKGEHPLPDRHFWEYAVHQVRRRVRHASSATGRTEPPALARERDQAIVSAILTMQAEKAMSQDAAAEESAQLLLDEAGSRLILAA